MKQIKSVMLIEKTNSEWDKTYSNLIRLSKLKGVKFSYAVSKNMTKIESHLKGLEKSVMPYPEYEEYDKLRVEIVEKYADKDENGKPIIEGNEYKVDQEKIKDDIEALNEKYKDVISERDKQLSEFSDMLLENVALEIHMVDTACLPEDISVEQMRFVDFMLND